MNQLNDQHQAQIVALQGIQAQRQLEDEPGKLEMHVDGPITKSLLCEDGSNNEDDSPCFQTGVQHDQTQRKIEEFSDIITLDELVQRQDPEGEAVIS